jgi:hypothetical protein
MLLGLDCSKTAKYPFDKKILDEAKAFQLLGKSSVEVIILNKQEDSKFEK